MKKVLFILPIALLCIFIMGCQNKYENVNIIKIEYSYGGGFGTLIDTATKTITLNHDGSVILSNEYNDYTETHRIDESKYNDLVNFIKKRMAVMDKKADEDKNIADGSSSHLKIELDDGSSKKFGGYMVKDKKYIEIKEKIYETIGYDLIDNYSKKMKENYSE